MMMKEGVALLSVIKKLIGGEIVLVPEGQVLPQDPLDKALGGSNDLPGPLLQLRDRYTHTPEGDVRSVTALSLTPDEYNALDMLVNNYSQE